ncbi:hypothetical protein EUGRSUZ_F03447 [Eucalyptus grandis]|uniref:Uncharacterized protein n=2 Tax=Eucalyptus grandis TaxID=71139 RepID=A0ACC3KMC2_EUCGR|nr:hypothetical protein EUGRSUZ_F03447 [Eucalyptus grandis]
MKFILLYTLNIQLKRRTEDQKTFRQIEAKAGSKTVREHGITHHFRFQLCFNLVSCVPDRLTISPVIRAKHFPSVHG